MARCAALPEGRAQPGRTGSRGSGMRFQLRSQPPAMLPAASAPGGKSRTLPKRSARTGEPNVGNVIQRLRAGVARFAVLCSLRSSACYFAAPVHLQQCISTVAALACGGTDLGIGLVLQQQIPHGHRLGRHRSLLET